MRPPRLGSVLASGAAAAIFAAMTIPGQAIAKPLPGSLRFVDAYVDGSASVAGIDGASGVAVSPDSRNLYVTGAQGDAVAVFRRTRGGLAFVESDADGEVEGPVTVDGLDGAAGVAVSSDGRNVYVVGSNEDALVTFARSWRSGRLRWTGLDRDGESGIDGLDGADGVAVTPDGRSVYVAGFEDEAVAAFARDPAGGSLGFLESEDVGGSHVLEGASAVAVSPDSAAVYVTAVSRKQVVSFARDPATGSLEFANANGPTEVLWPDSPVSVAVSPYGLDVYATALGDSAVNRFRRSIPDQGLAFTGFVKDGVAGTNGIAAASSVAIAPDATGAYVTGPHDDALAYFAIRDTTGELRYRRQYREGHHGVHGLEAAAGVAAAPDGRRVYAIANGGARDSLAVFARRRVPLLDRLRARASGLGDLRLLVRCSRSCRLTAWAHGMADGVSFSSGRFRGGLEDDRPFRIRLRFNPEVLRRLRGETAELRIRVRARDRLGNHARRALRVNIDP